MKCIRKVFQLMKSCDGHVGGVKGCGRCNSYQYVEEIKRKSKGFVAPWIFFEFLEFA